MNSEKIHRVLAYLCAGLCLQLAACTTIIENLDTAAARNVILFIGDGMGVSTVTAIRILDGQNKGMPGEENILPFERFPHVALSKTYISNQQVGESAATATALLTGRKTNAGLIGLSSSVTRGSCASAKGNSMPSALELAEANGMSTGIVSTTRLSHATPAAAFAHAPERYWENDQDLSSEARLNGCTDIAAQLIDFPHGNGIEVALGGGRINFLPYGSKDPEDANAENARQDNRNLVQEWTQKYPRSAFVWNQAQFDAIDPGATNHLLGLFNSSHMQYEADRSEDPAGEPSLAQMTRLAIEILEAQPKRVFPARGGWKNRSCAPRQQCVPRAVRWNCFCRRGSCG